MGARNPQSSSGTAGGLCQRHLEGSQLLESHRLEKPSEPTPAAVLILMMLIVKEQPVQGILAGYKPGQFPGCASSAPALLPAQLQWHSKATENQILLLIPEKNSLKLP